MKKHSSFQLLLGNITQEEFFEKYWGKEFLLIKGSDRKYFLPISEKELNTFFANSRLSYPYITLFSKGKSLNLEEFRNRKMGVNSPIVDLDKVFTLLQKGYSLTVNSLDRMEPQLADFCNNLSQELKTKFWTNVYITPAKRSGFLKHTDHHDVFAIQLSGKKTWTIYPSKADPMNITLEKGDFLYLPKNYPHEAHTDDSHSVHLTMGADFATYADLLHQIWKQARNKNEFTKRLNPNNKNLTQDDIEYFQKLVNEFIQESILQESKQSLQETNLKELGLTSTNRFNNWLGIEQLTSDHTLARRKSINWKIINKGKIVELQFENKSIPFPIFLEELLYALSRENPFKLKEIKSNVGEFEILRIAKTLLAERFLEIMS